MADEDASPSDADDLGKMVDTPGMLRSITKKRMLRRPGQPDVEIGEDGKPLGAGGSGNELLIRKRRRAIKRLNVADTSIGAMSERNGGPGFEQG